MLYKKNQNQLKNDNAITININDNLINMVIKIAEHHQRKPAELLRILLTPIIVNEWIKLQQEEHPENLEPPTVATFRK